jgi:hypothetical protein
MALLTKSKPRSVAGEIAPMTEDPRYIEAADKLEEYKAKGRAIEEELRLLASAPVVAAEPLAKADAILAGVPAPVATRDRSKELQAQAVDIRQAIELQEKRLNKVRDELSIAAREKFRPAREEKWTAIYDAFASLRAAILEEAALRKEVSAAGYDAQLTLGDDAGSLKGRFNPLVAVANFRFAGHLNGRQIDQMFDW